MLVATLQEERQKIYRQGQADGEAAGIVIGEAAGIAKGEAVGIIKGQRQTLLQLLQHRFQLNETEQANLVEQLAKITEAPALTTLIDRALQTTSITEFNNQLVKYLPKASEA